MSNEQMPEDQSSEEREAALKMEKAQIERDRAQVEKDRKWLEDERARNVQRDRLLTEREMNAERGFVTQNEIALEGLKADKAQILNEIDNHKQALAGANLDFEKAKVKKQAELDKWCDDLRQKMTRQVDTEAEALRKRLDAQNQVVKREFDESLKLRERQVEEARKELERRAEDLSNALQKLLDKQLDLDGRAAELKAQQGALEIEKRFIAEQRAILQETVKVSVEERVKEFQQRLTETERAEERWRRELAELREQLREYEQVDLQAGGRTKEELVHQIQRLETEMRALKQDLGKRPSQIYIDELEEKARGYQSLAQELKQCSVERAKLEQEKHAWLLSVSELQRQRDLREIEEKRLQAVTLQVEKYTADVERLKSQFDQPKIVAERVRVIEEPVIDRAPTVLESGVDEMEWLEGIYQKCQETGLHFDRRLLYSFHTALKTAEWSPLTILAGVSGTGKSELPKRYARYGGLYFEPLSVQPDWDSPQALLGYFNTIDNKYNATRLLRALAQFQDVQQEEMQTGNLSDSMLLVLLDEMNLAHVELYFSDLLSKLELGRGEANGISLEIDLGADHKKHPVQLGKNVLWVGTMNEDETTKALSDKVLDRGNLISFPRPVKFERRPNLEPAEPSAILKRETWQRWIREKADLGSNLGHYKEQLEAINAKLEHVGRALGHRVWQSIENYVASHPKVIQAQGSEQAFSQNMQLAFEEALVHKVMPKLRGIDTTDGNSRRECLDPIGAILKDVAPNLTADFEVAQNRTFGYFTWRSAKYLDTRYGDGE